MAALKKYNLAGQEIGQVAIEEEWLKSEVNSQMIKDYIVALRENARQWSAHTKTRAEVSHSGQKPHPQKGTGRARQGYLGAAQYKGGGRVHAPRAKFDQHVRINRKERRAAIRHLVIEKINNDRLFILETENLQEPKTKAFATLFSQLGIGGKKILILGDAVLTGKEEFVSPTVKYNVLNKSIRNIAGVDFLMLPNVSGYDILAHQNLIVMDSAIDELKIILGGQRS